MMAIVPLSSVESQDYFINLGHSKSCHSNLMSEYEYGLAKDVIVEGSSSIVIKPALNHLTTTTRKTNRFPATKKSEFRCIFRLDYTCCCW